MDLERGRVDAGQLISVTVVGVFGAGKSELVRRLRARGDGAAAVAQEHSAVPYLWRHRCVPDALVYLAASKRAVHRRGRTAVSTAALREQRRRLADARAHAHVVVQTDSLSPDDVKAAVMRHLLP